MDVREIARRILGTKTRASAKTKPRPFFSIVIPVHNGESRLPDAIQSALGQTFPDIEVVVVDDGSTDSTKMILERFAADDNRVRPLFLEQNKGTLMARKAGVENACATYILFLDHDDTLELDACATLHAVLAETPFDIVQFTYRMQGSEKMSEEARSALEKDFNRLVEAPLLGENIAYSCFVERKIKWTVTGKAFEATFLKRAFREMEDIHMVLGEDVYQEFVILSMAETYLGIAGKPLYNYLPWNGASFSDISQSEFAQQILPITAIRRYLDSHGSSEDREKAFACVKADYIAFVKSAWLSLSEEKRAASLPFLSELNSFLANEGLPILENSALP